MKLQCLGPKSRFSGLVEIKISSSSNRFPDISSGQRLLCGVVFVSKENGETPETLYVCSGVDEMIHWKRQKLSRHSNVLSLRWYIDKL